MLVTEFTNGELPADASMFSAVVLFLVGKTKGGRPASAALVSMGGMRAVFGLAVWTVLYLSPGARAVVLTG